MNPPMASKVRPASGDKPVTPLCLPQAAGSDWLPDARLSILARSATSSTSGRRYDCRPYPHHPGAVAHPPGKKQVAQYGPLNPLTGGVQIGAVAHPPGKKQVAQYGPLNPLTGGVQIRGV